MSFRSFILFPADDQWRFGVSHDGQPTLRDLSAQPTIEARAAELRDALVADGWNGQSILVALPSQWSLCASVDGAALPRRGRRRRETLLYRLEEELPVAAEDVVADFLPPDASGRILGFCTIADRISRLITAVEGAGIPVQSLTPIAVLAAQCHLQRTPAQERDAILLRSADGTDLLQMDGRQIADWWHCRIDDDAILKLHRRLMGAATDREPVVDVPEASQEMLAVEATADVLRGRVRLWIEFRRDALATRSATYQFRWPIAWAAAAMLLLGLSSAFVMLYRASAYAAFADANDAQLADLYRRTMPGQSIPATPRSRLVSEERRLAALAGVSTETPSHDSALLDLREVLTSLPSDLRFKILSLRIDDGKIDLRGKALSHTDADAIANAIRAGGRFSIDTPRTEQAGNDGVGFSFSGRAIDHNSLAAAGKGAGQ